MADKIPVLIMTEVQAANLRVFTAGANALEPVLIRGGIYKGRYMLPVRVKFDNAHEDKLDALTLLQEVLIDPEEAFPPEEETE